LEPDVGELGEAGETGPVHRALNDPLGVEAAEGGAPGDGDGVGVAFADVRECAEAG